MASVASPTSASALLAAKETSSPNSIPNAQQTHLSSSPSPPPPLSRTSSDRTPSPSDAVFSTDAEREAHEEKLRTLSAQAERVRGLVEEFLERTAEGVEGERLRSAQAQVRRSRGIILEALERYGLQHLALSFNGGKDCLLLLLLVLSVLPSSPHPTPLTCIYVPPSDPFPEVTSFVSTCITRYGLHLTSYPLRMKAAFAAYLQEHPWIKGIFVGTRRTDPHGGKLSEFSATDGGWAAFVRVNPVLEWSYGDVWVFLRGVGEEVCELYERGYTSLGGVGDTRENPALAKEDGGFRPAWELEDGALERAGRR